VSQRQRGEKGDREKVKGPEVKKQKEKTQVTGRRIEVKRARKGEQIESGDRRIWTWDLMRYMLKAACCGAEDGPKVDGMHEKTWRSAIME
jgi:hypothetical protein